MQNWRTMGKQAAVIAAAVTLAMTGASTTVAQASETADQATAMACGAGGVFLDGLRAMDVLEEGETDEVYIMADFHGANRKIWPTTAAYVSMAEGQRVEVDKCIPVGAKLRLWDDDGALNPNDFMGLITIGTEESLDRYFDNGSSRYRLGFIG